MARLRVEIGDFAELVRDIANRHQPLLSEKHTYGMWPFRTSIDVTIQEFEALSAEGPVVIESEFESSEMRVLVGARIPKLYIRFSCAVSGGGVLVTDGTRPLEIGIDGGATADARFAEMGGGGIELQTIHIDLHGFEVKFHVLPAWIERRLKKPIEKALEDALEDLIRRSVPANLLENRVTRNAAGADQRAVEKVGESVPNGVVYENPISRAAYAGAYYMGYGIVFSTLVLAGAVPSKNAAVKGLRDGTAHAMRRVRQIRHASGPRDAWADNSDRSPSIIPEQGICGQA